MLGPGQSGPWRTAHPLWVGAGLLAATLLVVIWPPLSVGALAWWWLQFGVDRVWRYRARRQGYRARWAMPGPAWWWRRRLRALGIAVPPGPVWETHAVTDGRWPGPPSVAAHAFREALTTEMFRLTRERPVGVAVVCSTFNRFTPAERAWILAHGGAVAAGAVHPRVAQVMSPRVYEGLQMKLFGGVVSHTRRDDPTRWTTWWLPARPE